MPLLTHDKAFGYGDGGCTGSDHQAQMVVLVTLAYFVW